MNRRDFLLSAGGTAISLASTTTVRAGVSSGSCSANVNGSRIQMIDVSHSLTLQNIERLSALGARTIGRYYVHEDASAECIPSKLFTVDESKAFKAFNSKAGSPGMAVVSAFQECNGCNKFVGDQSALVSRAQADGKEAARLAALYKQPPKSAIYFGVDFNAHTSEKCVIDNYGTQKEINDRIKIYFSEVGKQISAGGNNWKVGAYAGGDVCRMLNHAGLAEFFWLRASLADYGTPRFYGQKAWHIFQYRNEIRNYRGITIEGNVDADIINPLNTYYGQWRPGEAKLPSGPSEADAKRVMMGRAFYSSASRGFLQREEDTGKLMHPISDPVPGQGRACRLVKCFPAKAGNQESAGVSFEEGDDVQAYFYLNDLVVGLPYDSMPKLGDQPNDGI
jgi:Domain of unknown function (DUF1906)